MDPAVPADNNNKNPKNIILFFILWNEYYENGKLLSILKFNQYFDLNKIVIVARLSGKLNNFWWL